MALPTKSDLLTLDFRWQGEPFVRVEAKPLSTQTLDVRWRGMPFVAAPTTPTGSILRQMMQFHG